MSSLRSVRFLLSFFTVLALTFASPAVYGQNNEWTWVGGSKLGNQTITYGTLGDPSSTADPGSREGALTWTDAQGNFWLFGGYAVGDGSNNYSSGVYSDLWRFDASTREWTWVAGPQVPQQSGIYGSLRTAAPANSPGARSGAAGWTDSSGNLWLFGGEGVDSAGNSGYLNDLWMFNPNTNEWAWMGGGNVLPSCPSTNSCGAPGVYGTQGTGSPSNLPGGRSYALSWVDSSGNFWLFGGNIYLVYLNGWEGYENDLWMFNPKTNEWTWMGGSNSLPSSCAPLDDSCGQPGVYGQQQLPSKANIPGARENAVTWTDEAGNLWLFGGFGFDSMDVRGELNDLWEFNPENGEWAWVTGSNTVGSTYGGASGTYGLWQTPGAENTPGGRDSGAGWKDANGNLWLFGGYGFDASGNKAQLNDLWEFSPATSQWAWMSGSGAAGQLGVYGTLGVPSLQDGPGGRSQAAAWIDTAGNFWLFGGGGYDASGANEPLDDLWKFQPYADDLPVVATPAISPSGGTYTSVQSVTLSDSTPGAVLYYMIGTNTPPVQYTAPIAVTSSETIQVIASASGYANSSVSSASYTLNLAPPPAPTFSPSPGTYYGSYSVAITDADPYATIYYTTDGTTPTVGSKVYNGSILVSSSETINAFAVVSGGANSTVTSGTYTILPVPPNNWTFLRGSIALDLPGIYGQLGTELAQNFPGSRAGSATWTAKDGTLWLMGGKGTDSAGNSGWLNDLWKFDPSGPLQDDEWTWMGGSSAISCTTIPGVAECLAGVYGTLNTPAASNIPGGREGAATWTDSSGDFWLFGGYGYDSTGRNLSYLNDLWKFSPSNGQWTWMGGSSTAQLLNNAGAYGQPGVYGALGTPAAGNIPGSREYATTWIDSSGNLWMFGGQGITAAGQLGQLNDLWEFSPTTGLWTWVSGSEYIQVCDTVPGECGQPGIYGTQGTPAAPNTPGGRSEAAAWTDTNGNFWLFGGNGFDSNDVQGGLNDLWRFSPTTGQWTWVNGSSGLYCAYDPNIGFNVCGAQPGVYGTLGVPAPSNTPGGRSGAATWVDKSGNLWMFGNSAQNDVWMLNPVAGVWTWMGGDYIASNCTVTIYLNHPSVMSCDGPQGVGGSYIQAVGNAPGARTNAATWVDENGDFWLFGGRFASLLSGLGGQVNDLWQFVPSASSLPPAASPVFSLEGGNYVFGGPLTITNGMANATIHYTTDGTTPTTNSTVYQGPLTVSSSETVQAIAVAPGYVTSGIATVTFNFGTTPPAPTFSLPPGAYNQAQTVSITDNGLSSHIYYTNDGTTPGLSSPQYTGPIPVSSSETINAQAFVFGYGVYEGSLTQFDGLAQTGGSLASPDASAVYTINLPAPGFSISGTSVSVAPGATTGNTSTISLMPSGGFTGAINLSCTIAPTAASDPATCSIPASVTITGSTMQTVTLTVNSTSATSALNQAGKFFWPPVGGTALACILLVGIPARRRRWWSSLGMFVLLLFIVGGAFGCSGGGSGGGGGAGGGGTGSSGNPGTTPGSYVITVTGTSGAITQQGTVNLTVQ